jgi:O-antigen/teichoic acid export membrane protein
MTLARTPAGSPSLREQVLRGSVYLGARQVIGMVVSLGGAFVLMRMLGPREYGFYAAALGFFVSLQLVSQLGIGVYLIRREEEPSADVLHRAATLLVLLGALGVGLGGLTLPLVTRWSRLPEVALPTLALYAALPLSALIQVPMALLDRRLDYRRVAWIELSGQIAFYAVAVGAAVVRPTVWAPVLGWWTQQVLLLAGASRAASYLPRPAWDRRTVEEMIRYGFGYSAAVWLYQLRRAVNPLVVGRYLGAEAVGVVSLTFQLVVQLSFVAVSAWRLSTAALARVQADRARLLRAVEEGMRLQVPAVAPFLLLFAWLGPTLVPVLLGPEWRQVPELFPYVAGGFLFSAVFTMQSSALFVVRRNLEVGAAHLIQLILLAGVGLVLVPLAGLAGWGIAELSMIGGFLYMHRALARETGAPRYGKTLWLAGACALAMFTPVLGVLALVPLALVTVLAQPWRDLLGAVQALRTAASETRA